MPLTIGSNISSLKAQRRLSEGTSQLSKTFERLSSGQRINRAADDAAGLAISESLKSDKRVFNQGVRNFNDGISLLNIADGAIENISNIVVRLKELAEQSANGTYSTTQRKAIDKEAQALSKEYTRIVQSTKFNGVHLLNGSLGNGVRLQGGYGLEGGIFSSIGGAIGTGTFNSSVNKSQLSSDIVTGDLNGDGILDLVSSGTSGTGRVHVSLGRGDGTFGVSSSYSAETTSTNAITLGDLNGDGILDLVSAGSGGGGRMTVRLGNGDGSFGSATSYSTETSTSLDVTLTDVNSDGFLDALTAGNSGGAGYATVRLGIGDGTFSSSISKAINPGSLNGIIAGDINNDGRIDLAFADGGGTASVSFGNGDGTFGTVVSYTMIGSTNYEVGLGDFNGDGLLDLVSVGEYNNVGEFAIRLGSGSGNFGNSTIITPNNLDTSYGLAIGDLNGDGTSDVVMSSYNLSSTGQVDVLLGLGNGTFRNSVSYLTAGAAFAVTLGDLNQDGVPDILAGTGASGTEVKTNKTFAGTHTLLPFDMTTLAGARQALPLLEQKIQQLANQRGQIGAFQSRVQFGINNLQSASENYAAAESRIRDTDIADDSSKLLSLNILQQSAASILSQANLQPQLALRLLST